MSAMAAKRCNIWRCPDGRKHRSDWPILDAFHQLLLLIDQIVEYVSEFTEGAHNTQCLYNPIRYTTSPSLDEDQLLKCLIVAHLILLGTFFSIFHRLLSLF